MDRSKRQREDSLLYCQKCDDIMDANIECSGCKLKYCLRCAEISERLFQCISNGELANFHYNCASCKATFPSLENISGALNIIQTKHDERMTAIENRMDSLETKTSTEIKSSVEGMKEDIINSIRGDVDKLVDKRHREMEDRRRRDQKVVFFNLKEHSNSQGVENKNADEREVGQICSDLGLDNLRIVTSYRLGKRDDSKIRPLKVILEDRAQRKFILDNSKSIPSKAHPRFQNIFVVKDLTPTQRQERRERWLNRGADRREQEKKQPNVNLGSPMEASGYRPPAMATGTRMPSPVFRSPINALSQANILSGSFNSQHQHQAYDETTYVDSSTIIGGAPINNYTDQGAGARTSEVD